jgi:phage tail-like protein
LAAKPPLTGKKAFEFLRKAEDYNHVTIRPLTVSRADKDTAAAQPVSGGEATLDEVTRAGGKRIGTPYQKDGVQTKNIFNVSNKRDDQILRPPAARMSYVRKHVLSGNTFTGKEEFAQSHRFYVADITNDGKSVFEWEENGSPPTTLAAGFSGCTAPKFELASKEIKEGTWEFPRVFCTGANAQTITLSKGLVRTETGFYLWVLNAMRGLLTRRTIKVVSYGRNPRVQNAWSKPERLDDVASCVWTLYNCYPVGYRTSQDWDGDSGKIQISELDMHYEWFEESAGVLYAGVA